MNTIQDKTVLVTGGTGFVGSHLVEQLLEEGANVITTFQSLIPQSYFLTKKLDKRATMVPVDIVEFERLFDVVTKFEVDTIFHLAAQPLVESAFYNPRRTLDSNIRGTVNVLECARLYPRVKGTIVASSDKAYGKIEANKKYLESHSLQGTHPYEVSKSSADLIVQAYYQTYSLPVVTTRFGNIYGEGDLNFSRIIPGIMKSISTSTPLELRSDGTYVRDYLYVKDVVNGYILIAQNLDSIVGEVYNFGSNDTLSVLELISTIQTALKLNFDYKILNTAKNEIPYQSLDFSKALKQIGWKPQESVSSTAKKIFSWYDSHLFDSHK